ncbi:hypothetical protein F2Q69_00055344 [Brassica cretica]|uniref:Uncharacterized protein n=1 Tax=Brassica cretica TaxID=69181 RepID=A0A8S9N6I5_BRACR|nr:hypothetical protein F2Q69_00055344 [Brassica cretica]
MGEEIDGFRHALRSFSPTFETAFFSKVTEVLRNAKEHPAAAAGIGLTAGLGVKVPYEEEEDDGGDDDKEKEIVW